jgi:hypothetical protein
MAIHPNSRYTDAEQHSAVRHYYDKNGRPLIEDQSGNLRYVYTSATATYLVTTLPLPPRPPVEYFVKEDEHMPFLAYKFMDNSTRWWEIAEVNTNIWYPLDMKLGDYVRMPS